MFDAYTNLACGYTAHIGGLTVCLIMISHGSSSSSSEFVRVDVHFELPMMVDSDGMTAGVSGALHC